MKSNHFSYNFGTGFGGTSSVKYFSDIPYYGISENNLTEEVMKGTIAKDEKFKDTDWECLKKTDYQPIQKKGKPIVVNGGFVEEKTWLEKLQNKL